MFPKLLLCLALLGVWWAVGSIHIKEKKMSKDAVSTRTDLFTAVLLLLDPSQGPTKESCIQLGWTVYSMALFFLYIYIVYQS